MHWDVLLIGVPLLGSAMVWWHGLRRLAAGMPLLPRYEPRQTGWSVAALVLVALWGLLQLGTEIALTAQGTGIEASRSDVQVTAGTYVLLFLILFTLLMWADRLSAFGFRADGLHGQLVDGCLGFFASWLPVIALALLPFREPETQHTFLKLLREDPSWQTIAWLALAVVVLAPLVEELMFRVILQGSLRRWMEPHQAIIASAALFSVVHGWPDMLPLLPLALVLGYVYEQRHSYLAVVIIHALFNLTMLLATLAAGDPPADPTALAGP